MAQLTLANGLQVHLHHDPSASRAAALLLLDAGSHHTPQAWPGLAHLLEHLVFAGSPQYQGDERLMAWAQRTEARLNATTDDCCCAWFFDVSAQRLEEGLARLTDMLAQPLLTQEAIRQEVAVIEAEYQMLSADAATLRAAATRCGFDSPAALQRFHVGSAAAFGEDIAGLQQALRSWHQQHFYGGNLTLWLQGPQSVDELAQLARHFGGSFAASATGSAAATEASPVCMLQIDPAHTRPAPVRLNRCRHYALRSAGTPRLRLSFCLAQCDFSRRAPLTLLRQFLCDEAPGSLLAALRARDLCDGIEVQLAYCSQQGAILSIDFLLVSPLREGCAAVEALLLHWLQQLADTGAEQLAHYAALANRQFAQLSAVDQLRARAFGFPPPPQPLESAFRMQWQALLAQLNADTLTRLWVSPQADAADYTSQGFRFDLTTASWPVEHLPADTPPWQFYPLNQPAVAPELPTASCPLPHYEAGDAPVLLLSPAPGYPLAEYWGEKLRNGLRSLVAECAHAGGQLSFSAEQGNWLLTLSAEPQLLLTTLDRVQQQIRLLCVAGHEQGARQYRQHQQQWRSAIAVRVLLQQLPLIINGDTQNADTRWPPLPWCAALYGGDNLLQQQLAHLLMHFPAAINPLLPSAVAPEATDRSYSVTVTGSDAAVVLFCPLAGQSASDHAAWRLLAALFAPRFFQQLRIEQNLGYVVSCRFQQLAGVSGILFAVQSPTHSTAAIRQAIMAFIEGMAHEVATLDAQQLASQRRSLLVSVADMPAERIARCSAQWQARQGYAAALSADAINALSAAQLLQYYQQLLASQDKWWLVVSDNHSDIVSC